jgi:glycosyltransferase involved in cell wall biosynthesis
MRRHKILVRGPALSASGYGEQTRFALQCLKSREDIFDIFLIPINWGKTGWISHLNSERAWLDHLIMKTTFHVQNKGQFDISLQVTIPNEWEKLAPLNVGYTAGVETTLVAPQWVEKSALMDRIITTSKHAKDTLLNTSYEATNKQTGQTVPDYRVQTPTQEVNYCVRYNEPQKLDIELETDFNFLTVAQWGPRKNLGNTVRWFVEEFKNEENVGLVVKTNLMKNCIIDRGIMKDRLKAFLSEYPDRKCKVYLLHGNLSDGEMASLYLHPKIRGLLALTHGEGFGLPIFEAVCNGLPVVACDWSGQVDFLHGRVKEKNGKFKKRALFTKVDYELVEIPDEAVWDGVLQKGSRWCSANEKDAKRKLRGFYKNPTVATGKANKLKDYVLRQFAPEKKHAEFVEQVLLAGLPSLPAEDESVMVFD